MKLLRDPSAAWSARSPAGRWSWLRPVRGTLTLLCKVCLRPSLRLPRSSLPRAWHPGPRAALARRAIGFAKIALILLAGIAVSPAPTLGREGDAQPGRTPLPSTVIANPGKCIAPADEMRRNHMEMLRHQRERTLRQGVRGEPASLNRCIECHASRTTGSVLGKDNFCQSCHAYAAVKLDCFECHQPKAGFKAAGARP